MQKLLVIACLTTLVAGPALAASEGAIRHQGFKRIAQDYRAMGLVVQGKAPYNKDEFSRHAADLKTLSRQPFEHFASAATAAGSGSRPAVWSQPAKFAAERDHFFTTVDALDKAAQSADMAAIRREFTAVGQSCKSCHNSFRR